MSKQDSTLRAHALQIFNTAVSRVQPQNCIPKMVRRHKGVLDINGKKYRLQEYNKVCVIAFGKAALGMFTSLRSMLTGALTHGVVLTNDLSEQYQSQTEGNIRYFEGTHPLPSENNIRATEHIMELCRTLTAEDLVLFLISGGGSSLLFAPHKEVPFEEYLTLVDVLMKKGATIHELNTVRIALSQVKGGQLLRMAERSTVVNLIISDVIGNPPEFIASGPTIRPDMDTLSQRKMRAKSLLEQYGLYRKYQKWLGPVLEKNHHREPENNPDTHFIGTNRLAVQAAKQEAESLGYQSVILTTMLEGESRKIGHMLGTILLEALESGNPVEPPCCILTGGETTVTVTGEGKGGRNQELALGAADILRDAGSGLLLSAGTDGIDGPTDAAGAIVDSTTAFRAAREGLSIIDTFHENDSYYFFNALDDLVVTGPTGTNVMDVQVGLLP